MFNDIDYLLSSFQSDAVALNYQLGTLMKLQSGIDADQRYDKRRGDLARLFLPICSITLRHLDLISEEEAARDKLPYFTTSMLLMVNVWALRTTFTDKEMFHAFVAELTKDDLSSDFVYFLQLLLAIATIFHYKPEAVIARSQKRTTSRQNMDKLDMLNKGTGTAVQLLRTKVNSMPRSNTATTLESSEPGSLRSWKQIRTRGLSTTAATQSATHLTQPNPESDWLRDANDFGEEIAIDLDLATEVHHSIMDILEEVPALDLGMVAWHEGYLQVLVELIMSPTSSVCTLTRVMKVIRAHSHLLLPAMIDTPLLSCLCIRLPHLLCSGNIEVSKSAQLTILKILSETFVRHLSIALPAYWFTVGVCHLLGLKKHQNFSDVRHIRAGNLYFHLSEVLSTGYSSNDTPDFIAAYREFIERILSLIDAVDDFIDCKAKDFSSPWLLSKISELLFSNPIAKIDCLTALAVDQKESNPIEAGFVPGYQINSQ